MHKNERDSRQLLWLIVLASIPFVACGGTSSPSAGVGGAMTTPGTGGTTATGGTSATGGKTGSGGAASTGGSTTATGGRTGSGGTVASGGTTATGGTSATGGKTGAGGTFATGGSGGAGGTMQTGGAIPTGGSGSGGGPGSGGRASGGSRTGGNTGGGGSTGAGGAIDGGATSDPVPSAGCGKTPTLKSSPSTANQNTLTISGKSRQFIIRWPDNYDNTHPYRLILGLHGATGKDTDIGPSYFGLWDLAKNSTIFLAPSADGGLWDATSDTAFVTEILKTVEADLCIDTSRIMLEGFSQGAAMSWTLACGMPGVFRAAVGHSGGGVANPKSCEPVAYFGSLGLQENGGQTTQTDQFAKWDGCTVETLPKAPTGGHLCSDYKNCSTGHPVRWCPYDGGHTPSPTDSGQRTSWMPSEVWPFLSQF